MNGRKSLVVVAALIVLAMLGLVGYQKYQLSRDILEKLPPVSAELADDLRPIQNEMANMERERAYFYLNSKWPRIQSDVVRILREKNVLKPSDTVELVDIVFVKNMKDVIGVGADKMQYRGQLKNQLIAGLIYRDPNLPRRYFILSSFNELVPPDRFNKLSGLGVFEVKEQFEIGEREGLVNHVSYRTAVELARKHNLELYHGRGVGTEGVRISTRQAHALRSLTDEVQVTIRVYPGDRFNLAIGEFIPSPTHQHLLALKEKKAAQAATPAP